MAEVEIGVMEQQAKGCWPPPEPGKNKEEILPFSLQRGENGPANALISDF